MLKNIYILPEFLFFKGKCKARNYKKEILNKSVAHTKLTRKNIKISVLIRVTDHF